MMKKLSLTFATVAALFCLFAVSAFAMGTDLTVVTGDCNLRIGPGINYEIMTTIPSGRQVYINSISDGWAYVSYGNYNGWIASRFLNNQQNATPAPAPSAAGGAYSMALNHNMRSGPGTNYSIYTVVPAGATIYVQYVSGGWAYCSFGNYTGYVAIDGINGLNGSYAPTPVYSAPAYITPGTSIGDSTGSTVYNSSSAGTWYGGYNYANVYDYNYYRNNNPDLIPTFGDNAAAYLTHFVNYGMAEGRQAISSFNVYTYRGQHPELVARYGDDLASYYKHACGII